MNIIMLGAPGAGKGTISTRLNEKYKLPHISTGDIFRENIKNETELGKLAKNYIDNGQLVPDSITINLISDRLDKNDCQNGYILDGFPRNIIQAEGLRQSLSEKSKNIDYVIYIYADEDKIIDRLSGRRVCEKCGTPYHIKTLKPKVDGICDLCGGKLIQRKDDSIEVIKDRLKVYNEQTKPLIDYYKKEGILREVDGFDTVENVLHNVIQILGIDK